MPRRFITRMIPATEVAEDLLAQNVTYQRIVELNAQISTAEAALNPLLTEINKHLSNPMMKDIAKTYAKKIRVRLATHFEVNDYGQLVLVCGKEKTTPVAPSKPKERKSQAVPTMAALRERGKELGIDVDALGLGRQRREIAQHLDAAEAKAKPATKMVRTGDAVPVTAA